MTLQTSDLIKLNNLQLAGKVVSDRLMLGIHASKRTGLGTDFEQYRHYFPGDELRRIDWKLYGRHGKMYVKEAATESNLHIRFIIDLSGSMNYSENEVSRLQYAKILMASLAYLGFRQNDPMSLYALQHSNVVTLVKAGKNSFQRILYALDTAKAESVGLSEQARFPELGHKEKELLVFVTDFLQVGEELLNWIKSVVSPFRQILIFQILGQQETHFDLKGFYKFVDLETGKTYELDAQSIKKDFSHNSQLYLENLASDLQLPNVYLVRCGLSQPISEPMIEAMKKIKYG